MLQFECLNGTRREGNLCRDCENEISVPLNSTWGTNCTWCGAHTVLEALTFDAQMQRSKPAVSSDLNDFPLVNVQVLYQGAPPYGGPLSAL